MITKPQLVSPTYYDKKILFVLGLSLMIANKIRHSFAGYISPRPFSHVHIEKSVNYCIDVVQNWVEILKEYTHQLHPFQNKSVLEIGPGPDLGTGLTLLSLGANMYTAVDKHQFISQAPKEFYEFLLEELRRFPFYDKAETACRAFFNGESVKQFRYIHAPAFPHRFPSLNEKYDVLVSQAVLEHFSETELLLFFKQIKQNLRSNTTIVHEIDLSTHTRFLRDIDPLNILRYPDSIWNVLRFDGSPNRLRMNNYRSILEGLGYRKIACYPLRMLNLDYVDKISNSLYKRFHKVPGEDLSVLSFYLLAGL